MISYCLQKKKRKNQDSPAGLSRPSGGWHYSSATLRLRRITRCRAGSASVLLQAQHTPSVVTSVWSSSLRVDRPPPSLLSPLHPPVPLGMRSQSNGNQDTLFSGQNGRSQLFHLTQAITSSGFLRSKRRRWKSDDL